MNDYSAEVYSMSTTNLKFYLIQIKEIIENAYIYKTCTVIISINITLIFSFIIFHLHFF